MYLFTARFSKRQAVKSKRSLREIFTQEQLDFARPFAIKPLAEFSPPEKLSVLRAIKKVLHLNIAPVRQRLAVARSLRTPEQFEAEQARLRSIISQIQQQMELNFDVHQNAQRIIAENELSIKEYLGKLEICWKTQNKARASEKAAKAGKKINSSPSKPSAKAKAEAELAALKLKQLAQRDKLVSKGMSLEEANDLLGI